MIRKGLKHLLCISYIIGLFLDSTAHAATYHVSKHASASNSNNGSNKASDAWETPAYGAAQLKNGDILYIHAGTYSVSGSTDFQNPAIEPGASNTTIMAYPGDTVIINGGSAPTGIVIGVYYENNVVIDGFMIIGCVSLRHTNGTILQNCDISVGGDNVKGSWFGEVIYLEDDNGVTIRNNKLHDNVQQNHRLNSPLIMAYDSDNIVIEHNEIYNSVGLGIRLKDNVNNVHVRYNYIHDNQWAGFRTSNQSPQAYNCYIYQNIFENNNTNGGNDYWTGAYGGLYIRSYIKNIQIYNNTFIRNNGASIVSMGNSSTEGFYSWNNISYNPTSEHITIYDEGDVSDWRFMDYNCYYGDKNFRDGKNTYSLSNWKSHLYRNNIPGAEAHSIRQDPMFKDASNHNYKLQPGSPCLTHGRGGIYSSTIGAYITGDEVIGLISNKGNYDNSLIVTDGIHLVTHSTMKIPPLLNFGKE